MRSTVIPIPLLIRDYDDIVAERGGGEGLFAEPGGYGRHDAVYVDDHNGDAAEPADAECFDRADQRDADGSEHYPSDLRGD
jgi:hypothetical protein